MWKKIQNDDPIQWYAQEFKESSEKLNNRERGFYHLEGFMISDHEEEKEEWYDRVKASPAGSEMVLLQINLQNYRSGEISETGMEQIRTIFRAYKENETDLIVRFLYDWDGKAFLTEPWSDEIIITHMEQLKPVMEEFCECIYIVQGIFVGNWGEMHGSRHLSEKTYLKLLEKLHEVVPSNAFLAVRTPGYWRTASRRIEPLKEEEAWKPESLISRLSLYNDGIMGNELDYGTYGEVHKKDAKTWGEHWVRKEELNFQNQFNLYVPNGGEVIINNEWNDLKPAISTLREIHISYLNKEYDLEVLQKWKKEEYKGKNLVYKGLSGYEYIERHLGYRFVIRSANVKKKGFFTRKIKVEIEIENVGFSNRYTPCKTELIVYDRESKTERARCTLDTDVRRWNPEERVKIETELPVLEKGEYDLYLKITDQKRKEALWLANEKIGDQEGKYLLGRIKK